MKTINLQKISKLLTNKLGRKININFIERLGSGFQADGFRLVSENGEKFFIKRIKQHGIGYEFPERKIGAFMISESMTKKHDFVPQPLGIIMENGEESTMMPDLTENTKIYHIQEHIPDHSHDCNSYYDGLTKKTEKKLVDDRDLAEIEKITELISKIHSHKHFSDDEERLKLIYHDSLKSIIGNPELTLFALQTFPDDSKILPRKEHGKYLGLMLDNIYHWENKHDRLCALHGDFWGSNLFINDKGAHLIDFSRMPWGDPGIDIGWWMMQYLWFYHSTKNDYYKELGEAFLQSYQEKTNDQEIKEAISIATGIVGLFYTNPLFHPDLNEKIGKKFIKNVWQILEGKRFIWLDKN